jgi:hypothetical protein
MFMHSVQIDRFAKMGAVKALIMLAMESRGKNYRKDGRYSLEQRSN